MARAASALSPTVRRISQDCCAFQALQPRAIDCGRDVARGSTRYHTPSEKVMTFRLLVRAEMPLAGRGGRFLRAPVARADTPRPSSAATPRRRQLSEQVLSIGVRSIGI